MGRMVSSNPIPAITVSDDNRTKSAETTDKAITPASRKRQAEKSLCENVAVKRCLGLIDYRFKKAIQRYL